MPGWRPKRSSSGITIQAIRDVALTLIPRRSLPAAATLNFRSFVAALMPLLIGGLGIFGGSTATRVGLGH